MKQSRFNVLIEAKRQKLVEKIEKVCDWVDKRDADSYQLFQSEGYKADAYRATKALNSRLKTLLRRIPSLKLIDQGDIYDIIIEGMEEVRQKHERCGADESEVSWIIDDAVDMVFKHKEV